jgi:hypothetical protein
MMNTNKMNIPTFLILAILCSFAGGCGGGSSSPSSAVSALLSGSKDTSKYESIPGVPALSLGAPSVNAGIASFPLTIANSQGKAITALAAEIGYEIGTFGSPSTSAGKAALDAGKSVSSPVMTTQSGEVQRMKIAITDGKSPIGDGVVAYIRFSLAKGALPVNYAFIIVSEATSVSSPTPITGTK